VDRYRYEADGGLGEAGGHAINKIELFFDERFTRAPHE
jgi:hypothetical protein